MQTSDRPDSSPSFTVALIGPDGSGKSSIAHKLCQTRALPLRYVYMGVNLESSNVVLPTTWLALTVKRLRGGRPDMAGPPDPTRRTQDRGSLVQRAIKHMKTSVRLLNLMAEEWFRQILAGYYQRRGEIVVFDRHFFCDYYAYEVTDRRREQHWAVRLHGYLLEHCYPRPDLVIFLDAPAEVLFQRKGEGGVALLELRRQEYLRLRDVVEHFYSVDVTQSMDSSCDQVLEIISSYRNDHSQPVCLGAGGK